MYLHSLFVPTILLLFAVAGCIFGAAPLQAHVTEKSQYALSLSFDLDKNQVIGTAKITITSGQDLHLYCQELNITGSLLRDENGREHQLSLTSDTITITPKEQSQTLFLSYTKTVTASHVNKIGKSGIALIDHWYPLPQNPTTFELTATLPENFEAITESDFFPLKKNGNIASARFSNPTTTIHFAAGPYTIEKRQVREGLSVYSMFFAEERQLAADYLKSAAQYLNRYEEEIGTYPYNHYVIVANRLPTGFGMPTFTLMGQMVLRLPFIKNSSLGHEIVHSWFGNSVDVNYSQGNWCEGLTSFLADYSYREDAGEGAAHRKESITKYLNYVHPKSAIRLSSFTSASHNQYNGEAKRAVGYNRGALFFHELREKVGPDTFSAALRRFYIDNKGRSAAWDDLRQSFESASETDLGNFFVQRLTKTVIPELEVKNLAINYNNSTPHLSFTMVQLSDAPFSLNVPVQVETMTGTQTVIRAISEVETNISIPLETKPLSLTIDPEYTFLRKLSADEYPAVWAQFLGAEKKLVVLTSKNDREKYRSLLKALAIEEPQIINGDEISNKELSQNSILFLTSDQPAARSLFGRADTPNSGAIIDVRRNPLNRDHVAVLISSSTPQELAMISRRLSHYGKYSYLKFTKGKNTVKRIQTTDAGLQYIIEELPTGGATSTLTSFDSTVEQLNRNRVIYVGENHTSLSDHILQFRIIQALHARNKDLAIGMEMFPMSSQDALDRYTLGPDNTDERTFLKESEYYDVWRYDYRYFRDILHFAKKHTIPVIGLNLDKKIVSEVFRTGGTDSLDEKTRKALPVARDLDLPGYTDRLAQVHSMHVQGSHAKGMESGFIQAQALWDETMAQNIAAYLESHPKDRMVVLAGTQHTRNDSGIPPRVAGRIAVKQASVLNIYNGSTPKDLAQVADYYFFAMVTSLPDTPKIGVVLSSITLKDEPRLKISEISPHGKAAEGGLAAGDILKTVDGYNVTTMSDLMASMLDTRPGDLIDITVLRKDGDQEKTVSLVVELTLPPQEKGHP